MNIDELDIKVLKENFEEEDIKQLDLDNVSKIIKYLLDNKVYYAKDLFISSLDLFLLPVEEFIKRFGHLKDKIGNDFVDKLGNDSSLIEYMYD